MLKELEVYMNDKADEVYIAMRRDYNSVLGGGEVPQNGELLPKTQRLVRKKIIRIIDSVEKVFSKIAGVDFKDEDDEDDENVANNSGDEDGVLGVGKKEVDEDLKAKREASQETSPDDPMANEDSDRETDSKVKSAVAQERLDDSVSAKVDSGDSDGSEYE